MILYGPSHQGSPLKVEGEEVSLKLLNGARWYIHTTFHISNDHRPQAHDAVEIFIQHHSPLYIFSLLIYLILVLVLLMFLWKTFTLHLAYCTAASRKTFENLQDMYRTIQHPLGHRKSKRVPEKICFIDYFICFFDYAKAFDCVDHNKLWEVLQEMGIPDHLICLLRNLYAGQEATVRTRHGTADWFQIGKGVCQGCILSPCLFNLYEEYII